MFKLISKNRKPEVKLKILSGIQKLKFWYQRMRIGLSLYQPRVIKAQITMGQWELPR